ncbi:MAG: radical SAM protein [Chloroflexi bacterium]|nr:radical SAM protein [Chloroflexota bacterium]
MPDPELVVVWRITEHCDLGCAFCAYSRHLRRPRLSAGPAQVLAFGALLKEYATTYQRDVLVSWLGGEPLRWPPLFKVSHTFKNGFNLRLGVTTNGTALNSESVRRRLVEDFDQLTISVDGLGDFHDRGRDAPGLFEQLRLNIQSLSELKRNTGHGPLLRVNTILMRDNIRNFETLCRAVAEWGVQEITFNALGGRDRPEFFPDHRLLPEQVEQFCEALPGIRARMAQPGLTILGSEHYLERLQNWSLNLQSPISDCSPGQRFLFIDERGFIAPCSFTLQDYGIHLSEIRGPRDLAQLPSRLATRKRDKMSAPCFDCPSTHVFGKFVGGLGSLT